MLNHSQMTQSTSVTCHRQEVSRRIQEAEPSEISRGRVKNSHKMSTSSEIKHRKPRLEGDSQKPQQRFKQKRKQRYWIEVSQSMVEDNAETIEDQETIILQKEKEPKRFEAQPQELVLFKMEHEQSIPFKIEPREAEDMKTASSDIVTKAGNANTCIEQQEPGLVTMSSCDRSSKMGQMVKEESQETVIFRKAKEPVLFEMESREPILFKMEHEEPIAFKKEPQEAGDMKMRRSSMASRIIVPGAGDVACIEPQEPI